MKKKIVTAIFLLLTALFLLSTRAMAAEIGFSAAVITLHQGTGEIFAGQQAKGESSGIPTELFVVADDIRIGYRRYDQYAKDTYSKGGITGDGTARFRTEVLSMSYVREFQETAESFSLYGMAGLGLFQSIMTAEAYLTDGTYFASYTTQRKTAGMMNLGFLLGAGLKKKMENVFIGGEVNYVNVNLTYDKVDREDEVSLDASGIFLSFTTGVVF